MNSHRRALAGTLVVLLAPAAASLAQPPLFGTGVDLVALDLVVRDRNGRPIPDLRLGEIEVFEDGVRQRVVEFRAASAVAAAGMAALDPAAAPAGRPAAAPRPRGRARLLALAFDQLSVDGRPLAQKAARALLEAALDPDEYLAVFRIDGRLKLVENFTRDRSTLLASLDRATLGNAPIFASGVPGMSDAVSGSRNGGDPRQRGYDPRELRPAHSVVDQNAGSPMDGDGPLAAERGIANATLDILRTAEEVERTQRGNRSLDGLLSIVHGLRDLPGRKTVVFFSEGLQVPPWLEEAFRGLTSEANRANVSIYSVDVRGLQVAGHMDDARALLEQSVRISQSQRLSGGAWHGVTREQAREFEAVEATLRMNSQGTLDDLAKSTGGFLIGESNDLALGVRRLEEDTRSYYEVAYAPSDARQDGRFHKVRVKVRRPGASVQSREGYYAVPHAVAEPVYGYEGPLLAALARRDQPHEFIHQAAVFRFEADNERVRHVLAVDAPLDRLSFRRDERTSRYLGRVSVLALVKTERGEIVRKLGQDYLIEGPLADLEAARHRRVSFVRQVLLPPGAYAVETAVRDGLANHTGCETTRLVVAPPLPGVALSSVIGLAAAEKDSGEEGEDPLRMGEVRMTPEPAHGLRAGPGHDPLLVYSIVYPLPGASEAPRLTLAIARDGQVVRRGVVPLATPDAHGHIPSLAKVDTSALAAGEYTVRLSVSQGGTTASEESRLQVRAQ